MEHTPAPWHIAQPPFADDGRTIYDSPDPHGALLVACTSVASYVEHENTSEAVERANARRIVACVNYCEGLETGFMERVLEKGVNLGILRKLVDEARLEIEEEKREERDRLKKQVERLERKVIDRTHALGLERGNADKAHERVEELEEALGEMVEVFGDMADMVLHRRTQAKDKYPYKRAVSKAREALASTESRAGSSRVGELERVIEGACAWLRGGGKIVEGNPLHCDLEEALKGNYNTESREGGEGSN